MILHQCLSQDEFAHEGYFHLDKSPNPIQSTMQEENKEKVVYKHYLVALKKQEEGRLLGARFLPVVLLKEMLVSCKDRWW